MDKVWVDIPSGWQSGWPKVWDKVQYPDLVAWMKMMGCSDEQASFAARNCRIWEYQEDNP